MQAVEERVCDQAVLKLLRAMVRAGAMSDGMVRREVTGTPQGGPISPLLCNVYLHRLDRAWDTRAFGVLIRFADDAVVMCRSRQQAEAALARLTQLLVELGLEPKAAKTRIVHLTEGGEGLDFLGFTIGGCALKDAPEAKVSPSWPAGLLTRQCGTPATGFVN